MATRHQVRQAAVSLLYAHEMGSEMEVFAGEFLEEKKIRNDQRKWTMELFNGVIEKTAILDELLNKRLGKWKLDEIGSVERAILRLGAWELSFSDTEPKIIISEAVALANEMGSESAAKLINGVLDAISKNR